MRCTTLLTLILLTSLHTLKSQTSFNLDFLDGRIGYLKAIYSNDRAVRLYEDSTLVAAGFRSEAHLLAIDSLYRMDSSLTLKINDYLNTYGYPDKESYGETATMAPWLILTHSPMEKVRLGQFKNLYSAYKDGDLERRRMIEFLEREYQVRFGREFRSYNVEELRMKELMAALELKK